jgi:saccharopine dehydrogenase (NAD+, L-lysine-forming)
MSKIKIGIIKEGKVPLDKRVAITPEQARQITDLYPNVEVVCQSSNIRCFTDDDYRAQGIKVVTDISDCDLIFGVKEVPIPNLIADKTYFFFSHTIKKQPYNRDLLRAILAKNIRMIDYETLINDDSQRIIAFGRYAGIVGAYNGIYAYGKRYNLFHLRRASDCFDLEDMQKEFKKVKLPRIKIVLTGGGRVAKGAIEVLLGMGIRRVTPAHFLITNYDYPVFTQLNSRDYNVHKNGDEFNRHEFYTKPKNFLPDFMKYAREAEILIAAAYWDPASPVLFTKKEMAQSDFDLKVIADITCDIEGSIPSTKKPSTIADPIYDYDPTLDAIQPPLSDEGNVTVMAVDNLPCELPRNASVDFGNMLIENVLPDLLVGEQKIIDRATITRDGKLTEKYSYLADYVAGE